MDGSDAAKALSDMGACEEKSRKRVGDTISDCLEKKNLSRTGATATDIDGGNHEEMQCRNGSASFAAMRL